ncbi:S-layer homology domain-containing protein [Paenibacillus sp. GCM10027629]|uniref:S-layer homology domain-containing protein n=1 Tax=Paenibacillus sp. GCM10027629 TaxID=3273414 RepID=UPI00363F63E3
MMRRTEEGKKGWQYRLRMAALCCALTVASWSVLAAPSAHAAVQIQTEDEVTKVDMQGGDIQISGSNMVWFVTGADTTRQVMYRDLKTNQSKLLTPVKSYKRELSIHGDLIFWADKRNTAPGEEDWDIYMFDLKTGKETKISKTVGHLGSPQSDGRYVVWGESGHKVYLYDLKAGTEKVIGDGDYPKIANDKVFFTKYWYQDAGYLYDVNTGATTKVIVLDEGEAFRSYAFDGTRVLTFKRGSDEGGEDTTSVVLYDLKDMQTPQKMVLVPPFTGKNLSHAALGDSYAAWTQYVDGVLQIFAGDMGTGKTWQVTSGKINQKDLFFDGDRLLVMNDQKKLVYKTMTRQEGQEEGGTTGQSSTAGTPGSWNSVISMEMDELVEAEIGPDGGVLEARKSGISLNVPKYAFQERSKLTLTVTTAWDKALKQKVAANSHPVGPVVKLSWKEATVKPLTLHIPVDVSKMKPNQVSKLSVYAFDASAGKWEDIGGRWDNERKEMVAEIDGPGTYGLQLTDITYSDIQGHWAKEAIETAAARHLVQGVSAGKFEPNAPLTRAQFVTMLSGALKLQALLGNEPSFVDVPKSHWSYVHVEAAVQAGLVQGDQGKFHPNEKLSREAMTAMLVRAEAWLAGQPLKVTDESILDAYRDGAKVSAWARPFMASALERKLLTGEGMNIHPGQVSTRAQGVVMLLRMLQNQGKL